MYFFHGKAEFEKINSVISDKGIKYFIKNKKNRFVRNLDIYLGNYLN